MTYLNSAIMQFSKASHNGTVAGKSAYKPFFSIPAMSGRSKKLKFQTVHS
jgi:hypothetical protein